MSRGLGEGYGSLNARERQALGLLCRYMGVGEIATHMGISPKTVKHYLTSVYRALGLTNLPGGAWR